MISANLVDMHCIKASWFGVEVANETESKRTEASVR
jgi:hypothetical protein